MPSWLCVLAPEPSHQDMRGSSAQVDGQVLLPPRRPTRCRLMLAGCKYPAQTGSVWNCRMRSACEDSGSENVLYGWGKNAPPMSLPQGAGFSVGPGTSIRTVVLQVCFRQQACLAGVSSCVGSAVACSKGTGREAMKRGGDDSLAHAAATATLCVGARPLPLASTYAGASPATA